MSFLATAFFWLCAAAAVAGALGTVLGRNPLRSAMGLLLTIVGITGLYLALHAQFLAAIQLVVYAGAVVVLFVFVIMLLGPDATAPRDRKGAFSRTAGAVVFGATAVAAAVLLSRAAGGVRRWVPPARAEHGGIESFGRELYSGHLVPFEVASILLLVAIVGALAVARGKPKAPPPASAAEPRAPGEESG